MLRHVTDDLWESHHPHKLMGVFPLGHRMTVVRQPDGGLVLHSPIPLDDALAAELEELGPVRHVLAPSTMHNLFLDAWLERYPGAQFLAVPGFAAKNPGLRVGVELDDTTRLPGLRCAQIAGMPKVNECVVLHEASRSLIVADLVFHFPSTSSLALRALLRLVGAYGRVAASRLYRSCIKDRAAARASLDRVLAWDFDRLIVGHGDIVSTGAKEKLREAYAFLS
jgi:hypothetical protein